MTMRQGVRHGILAAGFELDGELVVEQLAHPSMLGNSREPLVQEIFEAEVIGPYDKRPSPEIGPPVSHGFDEADELIRHVLGMVWRNGTAKECQWPCTLVKHWAEVKAQHIIVDAEGLGEIRQLEYQGRGECALQFVECCRCFR
jgi:hypothetical protein